ncbi:MAG: hypothetical protein JNK11_12115, partial [Alphaproteobacteria bacterium]|nr:hypothetical protein [Alphaproteobacteria bacterium]
MPPARPSSRDRAEAGIAAWQDGLAGLDGPARATAASIAADDVGRRLLAAAFAGSPFLGQLLLKEQAAAHRLFGVSPRAALAAVLADLEAAAQAA